MESNLQKEKLCLSASPAILSGQFSYITSVSSISNRRQCLHYMDGEHTQKDRGLSPTDLLPLQALPGVQSSWSENSAKSCNTPRCVSQRKGNIFRASFTPLELLLLGVQEDSLHPFLWALWLQVTAVASNYLMVCSSLGFFAKTAVKGDSQCQLWFWSRCPLAIDWDKLNPKAKQLFKNDFQAVVELDENQCCRSDLELT